MRPDPVWIAMLSISLAAALGAPRASPCLGVTNPAHASTAALPDTYWRNLPDWRDLSAAEQDFLARVAIATRNKRAAVAGRVFQSAAPEGLAAIPERATSFFIADGVDPLMRLLASLRAHLAQADPGGAVELGAAFRSYDEQLQKWPGHIKRYFLRHREALAPYLMEDGYSDAGVCIFRDLSGKLYGFPGYSNHQSGRAIDFRTRVGPKGQLMTANTDPAAKEAWRATPFFQWMRENARGYGFVQEDIDEPWHWVYDPVAAAPPQRAVQGRTSQ